MQEFNPYVFASQYQQNPIPAGGALFREEWFVTLDEEPDILATFITADTAETDKTYNDATAFLFWGVYKIKHRDVETEEYGLHVLDCVEIWVEPRDLEAHFYDFYAVSMRHWVKPLHAAIEKKSTGVTLASILEKVPGIRVVKIDRPGHRMSKADRFLEMQPYLGRKQVTLPRFGKHVKLFVDHMIKITANNTHRRDDIADATYDAVRAALIDKVLIPKDVSNVEDTVKQMESQFRARKQSRAQTGAYEW
jgi:hypothetical protein